MNYLPYLIAAWLLIIGAYGIVTSQHLVHLTVCLSVMQSATYVLLLSIGYRTSAGPPVFANVSPDTPAVDPVVQALTLTDIVVGATVTALLLALATQVHKHIKSVDPSADRPMEG